jgi:hypothetical protein
MRKINGLRHIFNDYDVLELTPRLNSTEISLHVPENIRIFALSETSGINKETYIDAKSFGRIIHIYII